MIKCLFGLHEYEVYKEVSDKDVDGNDRPRIIISRCKHCGHIKQDVISVNMMYESFRSIK